MYARALKVSQSLTMKSLWDIRYSRDSTNIVRMHFGFSPVSFVLVIIWTM